MSAVEPAGYGLPLNRYVLTRKDHNDQRTMEHIDAAAQRLIEQTLAEEAADPELKAARAAKLREAVRILIGNHPQPDELQRWRVRLYCGHIAEMTYHRSYRTPAAAGGFPSGSCGVCRKDNLLVVAWEHADCNELPREPSQSVAAAARPGVPRMARAYTVTQVAEALQVPDKQVYALIHSGELQAKRVGRHYRIPTAGLERYLAAT